MGERLAGFTDAHGGQWPRPRVPRWPRACFRAADPMGAPMPDENADSLANSQRDGWSRGGRVFMAAVSGPMTTARTVAAHFRRCKSKCTMAPLGAADIRRQRPARPKSQQPHHKQAVSSVQRPSKQPEPLPRRPRESLFPPDHHRHPASARQGTNYAHTPCRDN